MSPWAVKRLHEFGGDITRFRWSSSPFGPQSDRDRQDRAGRREQPGHLALVGKVDIRKLEEYAQDDPDAYSYSGGLCLANQGLLEFVEMFKAPIKVLHPLLTATQEGNYKGTEGFGAIPFDGIVLAHSNESEWQAFRNNKNNEAFSTASTSSRCPTACACPTKSRSTRSCSPTARCPRRPARPTR
jgi:serine protein kinase